MKSICVSQHRSLKVLLLMWSSPAALVKVKLSASRLSTGPQSFFSHALYHFRMISSLVILGPANDGALATPWRPTPPASVQAPATSRFLRDTVVFFIVRSPSPHWSLLHSSAPGRLLDCQRFRICCHPVSGH